MGNDKMQEKLDSLLTSEKVIIFTTNFPSFVIKGLLGKFDGYYYVNANDCYSYFKLEHIKYIVQGWQLTPTIIDGLHYESETYYICVDWIKD